MYPLIRGGEDIRINEQNWVIPGIEHDLQCGLHDFIPNRFPVVQRGPESSSQVHLALSASSSIPSALVDCFTPRGGYSGTYKLDLRSLDLSK